MLRVQVAPELRWLLPVSRRDGEIVVCPDGTSSLGHVISSLGVPLTEVGPLRVDGREVERSHRPRTGEVVEVSPAPRPQPAPTAPPRFLLDVHLGSLARRLRLLGVDAAYRPNATDQELVEQALAERRVLLSQDRGLLRRRAVQHGAHVRGAGAEEQLGDVLDRFAPPLAPWTRCVACNGLLEPVAKRHVAHLLEPGTRRSYQQFARCRSCGQLYWRGAHAERLDTIVTAALRRQRR